jgi:hypothetical protein
MSKQRTATITFTEDVLAAIEDVVKGFVYADDEYISNHNPVRIGLLQLMKASASLSDDKPSSSL